MTVLVHRSRGREPDDRSWPLVILKAIVTVVLVTAVVATALGAAAYVVSQALVAMMR